jgi:hypothetical protein
VRPFFFCKVQKSGGILLRFLSKSRFSVGKKKKNEVDFSIFSKGKKREKKKLRKKRLNSNFKIEYQF